MQELVRRLVERCERHEIRLVLTHTPGAKLDRPDQTSRGDPVEEPRRRLPADVFRRVEERFGSFNSFIGPERAHHGVGASAGEHAWFHPTPTTVGSALRLLNHRAKWSLETGHRFSAMILVPNNSRATWQHLPRLMSRVAQLGIGRGRSVFLAD